MKALRYYSNGKKLKCSLIPTGVVHAGHGRMRPDPLTTAALVGDSTKRLSDLYGSYSEAEPLVIDQPNTRLTLLATETMIVEGASKAELKVLRSQYGLEVIREGLFGKTLLRNASEGGAKATRDIFENALEIQERGNVRAAHPNFIRLFVHTQRKPSSNTVTETDPWWHHLNDGTTGIRGADTATRAAWTIHRGNPDIRVAILDEGVDAGHPDLKAAVVAEHDAVDGHDTAMPDGNDAHGTACAGIVGGRGVRYPGISACSLVAVRIAKGDGRGNWVFDDFATSDAIDWAWQEGKADVLSNSWGGGPPVDAITNAFERARVRGRDRKGAVIVIAAGNLDGRIGFPGSLPNVLCVGASNEWDERKSPTSRDGERNWGSCHGRELSLVAPGVHIATTDISGRAGYGPGDHYLTFNGTSSATPQVAAAAAIVLSVAPKLTEKQVREIITGEATRMNGAGQLDPQGGWNEEMGWGRLDIHAALRRALRS